jgi:hypothetical protein
VYPKRYLGDGPGDTSAVDLDLALACERFAGGPLGQPANALTSLAFVLAGGLILAGRRGTTGQRWPYAALVIAVGVGSVVQHGPHPPWQACAHDLPLASLLAFVAADAAADLTGDRARVRHWWLATPVAMVPVVMAGPLAASLVQGLLAAVAIGLSLARARLRPRWRRTLYRALAVLVTGALLGALTDRTPLCQPESLWQGHAAWHLLAAAALWLLAPAIGSRGRLVELGAGEPVVADRRLTTETEPA